MVQVPPDQVLGRSAGPQRAALLAFGEHWTCAVVRAELIERGVNGRCAPAVSVGLLLGDFDGLPDLLVVENETLSEHDRLVLDVFGSLGALGATVLVTDASSPVRGRWDRVLRRPIAVGGVADGVEEVLRASSRAPAVSTEPASIEGSEVRLGAPWPMIRCTRCSSSRHCELPQLPQQHARARTELAKFALEHGLEHQS